MLFLQKKRGTKFFVRLKNNWQLHLLILLPLASIIIFCYVPMYGAQIAFRDFKIRDGIWGSAWVGLKHFIRFFKYYGFSSVVSNTVTLSLYGLLVGFPLTIIFALMLNTVRNARFRKFAQTLTYMPNFISVVVIVGIINQIFNPVSGVVGAIYRLIGGAGYLSDLRASASAFRHMYVWSGVWQGLGFSTIIYTAALSGVSPELHEAAMIDGATRFQRVLHVDIPAIMPTAAIMLILSFGSVMSVGFEKVYLMQNSLNISVSQVISTYVYGVGFGTSMDMSYGAAIGLFNSVINCTMILLMNFLSKKLSSNEVSLF